VDVIEGVEQGDAVHGGIEIDEDEAEGIAAEGELFHGFVSGADHGERDANLASGGGGGALDFRIATYEKD
jgi:hypothetical protein